MTTKKKLSQPSGNCGHSDSNFEVDSSQVCRQEKVNPVTRKLGQRDQTRAKSEEDSPYTGKLDAVSPEMENMRFSDHLFLGKIFQCLQKKLERSAIDATFSVESYKTNVLPRRMLMASSMKAAIHLRPDFTMNSEIYKNTRFENIVNVFNITQKINQRTF